MEKFNPMSLSPAANQVPGVRMEERSPGSYRFSIRGSLLRSPFGVRNIKFYWNELPFTDAGGNTYLNILDPTAISSWEVLKGPPSSMYGTGTGGAVFLRKSLNAKSGGLFQAGSYGQHFLKLNLGNTSQQTQVSHLQAAGYRANSRLERTAGSTWWQKTVTNGVSAHFGLLMTKLFYETPGGLTLDEMRSDPRMARPASGPNPGAIQQKASVSNQTLFGGGGIDWQLDSRNSLQVNLFGGYTDFANPAIRNYENRYEANAGTRIILESERRTQGNGVYKWVAGLENQWGWHQILVRTNTAGNPGTQLDRNRIQLNSGFLFLQNESYWGIFGLQSGIALNRVSYQQKSGSEVFNQVILTPRVALSVALNSRNAFYLLVSRGFSPPTLAELTPSATVDVEKLQAESGQNWEGGFKYLSRKIRGSIALFSFGLQQAIVSRRDSEGAEYFVNAGNTRQNGIEWFQEVGWQVGKWKGEVTVSFAGYDFRFKDYRRDNTDFSGNQLTGVPRIALALNGIIRMGRSYFAPTFNYQSKLPLDDGNTVFAERFSIVNFRMGHQFQWREAKFNLYVGGDNIFNTTYSSGFELNAVGGRFYNPAATSNYYLGLSLTL